MHESQFALLNTLYINNFHIVCLDAFCWKLHQPQLAWRAENGK